MVCGGGGGGGDVRSNFADTAYFETVPTNSKGIAKVTFKLPHNVTTYRVTAHSATEDLYVGVNTTQIVSKLNFFIQFTEPRNVKTTDDLVLNATSIAEEKYDVEYEFTIKELNKTKKVTGSTNSMATVNFGKIPYGTYTAVIKGKHGDASDAVEYKFNIIESAQEVKTKTDVEITNGVKIEPTKNPIVLEIYNKNMKQYVEYLNFIEKTVSTRLDTQIAYNESQKIKDKYYGTTTAGSIINISEYEGKYLKNLPTGQEDIVLSALVSHYTKGLYEKEAGIFTNTNNLFESYLLAAANNQPVLIDLLRLKEEQDIANYNKLLVTLSLEFLGDFENARELYNSIQLTEEEANEYKSIVAIIETFINKESATSKINELIANSPADEYLRFAILSYFKNGSAQIEKESEVIVKTANSKETIKLNGMKVKSLTINNQDLTSINFETQSKDLMVSYYYQTLLDNIEAENISKDMKISINGELKKGNTVTLVVELPNNYEGQVRIALPNSLRLAENYIYKRGQKYYLQNNQIDYATYFKQKECTKMEIPLVVTYEGSYKFENIVCNENGTYYISNSIDLNIDGSSNTINDSLGDANSDGEFNSKDLNRILKYLRKEESLEGKQLTASDVNCDGQVDYIDYELVFLKLTDDSSVKFPYDSGEKHNITYNLNGGSLEFNKNLYAKNLLGSELYSKIPVPTKEGYVFLGWTGSNGKTPQTTVTIPKGTTGNLSYTANWKVAE